MCGLSAFWLFVLFHFSVMLFLHNILTVAALRCFLDFFIVDFFFLEREKEKSSIYCSTDVCTHWLIPVCALPGDQTCNPGVIWTMLQPTEPPGPGCYCFNICHGKSPCFESLFRSSGMYIFLVNFGTILSHSRKKQILVLFPRGEWC